MTERPTLTMERTFDAPAANEPGEVVVGRGGAGSIPARRLR